MGVKRSNENKPNTHTDLSTYSLTSFIFFFNKGKEKTNVKQTSNLTIEKVPEHCLEFFK